jgi:hypothetical protein
MAVEVVGSGMTLWLSSADRFVFAAQKPHGKA